MIIPDLASYLVNNVGLNAGELRWVYLVGGVATLFTMNGIGRLADRFGRMRMFGIMMVFSMVAAFLITHLPVVPATVAIATSTFFMISMTGALCASDHDDHQQRDSCASGWFYEYQLVCGPI